jgi:hypothetical protein
MDGGTERLAQLIEARSSARVSSLLKQPYGDILRPGALSWLKEWGPSGVVPKLRRCRCTTGNCEICN